MFTAGFIARRTRKLLADGNDDIVLYIHRTGRRVVSQRGREATIEPGFGVLASNAEPSTITIPEAAAFVCIAIPRKPLLALIPNVEDLLACPVPSDNGALQLLDNYLGILEQGVAVNTPALQCAMIAHIYDLLAVALGAAHDHLQTAKRGGIAAARIQAIKADIAKNLADGDVSAGALAARHRVSARYIHKLFETEGTTLSKYVLGQRLSRVHRMLTNGRQSGETIGALAYAVGFGDLSTFNHAFRSQFGATPSDVRAAARLATVESFGAAPSVRLH
jgi:AraC-like DNA-binding protein